MLTGVLNVIISVSAGRQTALLALYFPHAGQSQKHANDCQTFPFIHPAAVLTAVCPGTANHNRAFLSPFFFTSFYFLLTCTSSSWQSFRWLATLALKWLGFWISESRKEFSVARLSPSFLHANSSIIISYLPEEDKGSTTICILFF